MPNFKLTGFADEAGVAAEDQIKVLKANGIGYAEVRTVDGKNIIALSDDELKAFKKKLDSAGIKVSAIGSPIGKTPIEEDFALTLKNFERALSAADILDSPFIRAFSFYMPKDTDPMQYADEVIKRLKELVKITMGRGKQYALENESGIFTDIPQRCAYVLDRIPDIRFVFDPCNFIFNNAPALDAWALLKKRVTYFHIKDGNTQTRHAVPAGEGEGKIPEILKAAYAGGFDSFLSIEPHLKYMGNCSEAQHFTIAANGLKKVLNETFNAGLKLADV